MQIGLALRKKYGTVDFRHRDGCGGHWRDQCQQRARGHFYSEAETCLLACHIGCISALVIVFKHLSLAPSKRRAWHGQGVSAHRKEQGPCLRAIVRPPPRCLSDHGLCSWPSRPSLWWVGRVPSKSGLKFSLKGARICQGADAEFRILNVPSGSLLNGSSVAFACSTVTAPHAAP